MLKILCEIAITWNNVLHALDLHWRTLVFPPGMHLGGFRESSRAACCSASGMGWKGCHNSISCWHFWVWITHCFWLRWKWCALFIEKLWVWLLPAVGQVVSWIACKKLLFSYLISWWNRFCSVSCMCYSPGGTLITPHSTMCMCYNAWQPLLGCPLFHEMFCTSK